MQVHVTGVDEAIARLREQLAVATKSATRIEKIFSDLIAATPVDTGDARRGWRLLPTRDGFSIVNDVPYIAALNNGHSKQAPKFFIEKVLLSHGKANGAIVINTP